MLPTCVQVADSKTVWGLYKQGCTLQVHQPQRFHPPLAAVCSGLEQRLGCLVGINAYLTPSSIQVMTMAPARMLSQLANVHAQADTHCHQHFDFTALLQLRLEQKLLPC